MVFPSSLVPRSLVIVIRERVYYSVGVAMEMERERWKERVFTVIGKIQFYFCKVLEFGEDGVSN